MRSTTLISILALGLPPAAVSSTSCVMTCTAIGYENGLSVRIGVPPTSASYRVEVEAEGDVLSLSYDVSGSGTPVCTGPCQAMGSQIELAGGIIGTDNLHLVTLVGQRGQPTGPSAATVRVFRSNALVGQASFQPRYQTDEPNGPGCGTHTFASESLDVP